MMFSNDTERWLQRLRDLRPLITAALVIALGHAVWWAVSVSGGPTYGPDNPMPLDVAAGVVVSRCQDSLEADSSYENTSPSVESCIERRGGLFMAMLLRDEGTSVIESDGTFIDGYSIQRRIEDRALEMWSASGSSAGE